MNEREVKARVKRHMISTGMRSYLRCFAKIEQEVTKQTARDLPSKKACKRGNGQLNHNRGCLDCSTGVRINDSNAQAFAKQMNKFTGFRIVTENINSFFYLQNRYN